MVDFSARCFTMRPDCIMRRSLLVIKRSFWRWDSLPMYINLFTSSTLHLCSHSIYPIAFLPEQKRIQDRAFYSHIRTVISARIRKALCETMTVTATATVTSKRSRFCKQNNNSARAPRFFEISLPSLHDYDLKWPNCKLFWGRERQGDIFYPAVWTRPSPLSSVPTKVSFFLVIGRLRIIAKWLKRMRSLSFNELLMDVAVVGS